IRLWVDSTKDPWFDARWNWDELVHWPKAPAGTAPLEELRAFLRFCRDDGGGNRFVTWEFSTPHRGPGRGKLVEFGAVGFCGAEALSLPPGRSARRWRRPRFRGRRRALGPEARLAEAGRPPAPATPGAGAGRGRRRGSSGAFSAKATAAADLTAGSRGGDR